MKKITAMGGSTKFIFSSADSSVRDEATEAGAIFLEKPASLWNLIQAIESLASRPWGR